MRRVTKPLKAEAEALTVLAEGRTDVEVRHPDRYDEIGAIAWTVGVKNKQAEATGAWLSPSELGSS